MTRLQMVRPSDMSPRRYGAALGAGQGNAVGGAAGAVFFAFDSKPFVSLLFGMLALAGIGVLSLLATDGAA